MKTKRNDASVSEISCEAQQHGVQLEIDRFLRAVSSYPDRFAREPHLSFQQHFSSLATAARPTIPDEDRHR